MADRMRVTSVIGGTKGANGSAGPPYRPLGGVEDRRPADAYELLTLLVRSETGGRLMSVPPARPRVLNFFGRRWPSDFRRGASGPSPRPPTSPIAPSRSGAAIGSRRGGCPSGLAAGAPRARRGGR